MADFVQSGRAGGQRLQGVGMVQGSPSPHVCLVGVTLPEGGVDRGDARNVEAGRSLGPAHIGGSGMGGMGGMGGWSVGRLLGALADRRGLL